MLVAVLIPKDLSVLPIFLQLRNCCVTALRMRSVINHWFRLFITLHLPQLFLQSNSVSNPSLKVLYGHENRLATALDPSWHLLLNFIALWFSVVHSNLTVLYVTALISVICYGSLIYNPLCNYRVSHLFDSFLPALATFTQDFAPKVIIFLVHFILRDFCFHLSLFRQIVATIVKFYIEMSWIIYIKQIIRSPYF